METKKGEQPYLHNKMHKLNIESIDLVKFHRYDCKKNSNEQDIQKAEQSVVNSKVNKIVPNKDKVDTTFFLFDYYDSLTYVYSDDDKPLTYRDCFGLDKTVLFDYLLNERTSETINIHHPKIASQRWSLIKIKSLKEDKIMGHHSSNISEFQNYSNVFKYKCNAEANYLSELPYIGLVSLSIPAEFYSEWHNIHKCKQKANFFKCTECNIEDCPNDYEECIKHEKTVKKESELGLRFIEDCMTILDSRITQCMNTKRIIGKYVIDTYLSPNYGDLCIVIRTDKLENIYSLVYNVKNSNGLPDRRDKNNELTGKLNFVSLTTIGVETGLNKDKMPLRVKDVNVNEDALVVIRMAAKLPAISDLRKFKIDLNEIDTENYNNVVNDQPYALAGRYDISIRLPYKEFNYLYPSICFAKLNIGKEEEVKNSLKKLSGDQKNGCNYEILNCIMEHILNHNIDIVNERILLDIDNLKLNEQLLGDKSDNEKNNLINKDKAKSYSSRFIESKQAFGQAMTDLLETIDKTSQKAWEIPFKRNQYIEEMRLVKDLYLTYLPMWHQEDSFVNDWFLHSVLSMLLAVVERYIKEIERRSEEAATFDNAEEYCNEFFVREESNNELSDLSLEIVESKLGRKYKKYICEEPVNLDDLVDILIKSLKHVVYSLNNFAKMVQSVNVRTFQKPNYEIESHVDNEKYIMALTRYVINISKEFFGNNIEDGKLRRNRLSNNFDMLVPIIHLDLMSSNTIVYHLFNNINLCSEYSKLENDIISHYSLLPITIPSYERFAKAYELIPLLLHEISHTYRFVSRDERNGLVVQLVCKYLSIYISDIWIGESNSDQNVIPTKAITDILSPAIYEALHTDELKEQSKNKPLILLEQNLNKYFTENLFYGSDGYTHSNPSKNEDAIFIDACKYIYSQVRGYDISSLMTDKLESIEATKTILWFENFFEEYRQLQETSVIILDANKSVQRKVYMLASIAKHILVARLFENLNEQKNILINTIKKDVDKLHKGADKVRYTNTIEKNIDKIKKPIFYCVQSNNIYSTDYDNIVNEVYRHIEDIYDNIANKITNVVREVYSNKYNEMQIEKAQKCLRIVDEFKYNKFYYLSELKTFFNSITDISYQVKCAQNALYSNSFDILEINTKKTTRNRFIQSVSSEIKNIVNSEDSSYNTNVCTLHSPKIFSLLNSLNLNIEDEDGIKDTLLSCLKTIPINNVVDTVHGRIENYKEIIADLSMCSMLQLTPFGYLQFTLVRHSMIHISEDKLEKNFTNERIANIIYVMMLPTEIANNGNKLYIDKNKYIKLIEDIKSYIINTINFVKHQLMSKDSKGLVNDALNRISENLLNEVALISTDFLEHYNIYTGNSIRDWNDTFEEKNREHENDKGAINYIVDFVNQVKAIENDSTKILNKFLSKIENLERLVEVTNGIHKDWMFYLVDDTKFDFINLHYHSLYIKEMSSSVEDAKYQIYAANVGGMRAKIGEYINATNPYFSHEVHRDSDYESSEFSSNLLLKNTFEFITQQYYASRLDMNSNSIFGAYKIHSMYGLDANIKKEEMGADEC